MMILFLFILFFFIILIKCQEPGTLFNIKNIRKFSNHIRHLENFYASIVTEAVKFRRTNHKLIVEAVKSKNFDKIKVNRCDFAFWKIKSNFRFIYLNQL
jgi:hypothetical protein